MKFSSSSNILSIALALNGALASPLRARGYAVVTITEFETKTVDVTLTTWVDPAQYTPTEVPTPTTDPNEKNKNHVTTSTSSVSISETLASPTVSSSSISELSVVPSSTLAYSSVETTQQTTSSIPSTPTPSTSIPTTTSSSTTSLPTTTSIPTTTSEPPTSTPSPLPTSTSISVPTYTQVPPTTLEKSTLPVPTTPASTPPAKIEPSTTAPAPTAGLKTPSAGGGSTVYTGDATFYNTGLGSCGIQSKDTDCIAAISALLYDSKGTANPNNNPLCNTVILVSYKGGPEIPVTIVDRCPECAHDDLDLSPAAFTKMGADQNAGRVKVNWRYAS